MIFQSAGLPGTARFQLAGLNLVPRDAELVHHLVECRDADARQTLKAGAASQAGGGKHLGHRAGTFAVKVPFRLDVCRDRSSPHGVFSQPAGESLACTFATGLMHTRRWACPCNRGIQMVSEMMDLPCLL